MDKVIMMYIQDNSVVKGEINFNAGRVTFYDRFENILMKREGLSPRQLNKIRRQIQKRLIKRQHVGFYYV